MSKIEISKIKRIIELATSKYMKIEGAYENSIDIAFEVVDSYKSLNKYDDYVRYFMVDAIQESNMFEGEEYKIVVENDIRYISPIIKENIIGTNNNLKSKTIVVEKVPSKLKTNKELLEEVIVKEGLTLCSCTKDIEKLPKKCLQKVIDVVGYGSSVTVHMNFDNIDYIVEVSQVDNEIDIWLITRKEYECIYGEILEEDWDA